MNVVSLLVSGMFRRLAGFKVVTRANSRNNALEISNFATDTSVIHRFVRLTFIINYFKVRLQYYNIIGKP